LKITLHNAYATFFPEEQKTLISEENLKSRKSVVAKCVAMNFSHCFLKQEAIRDLHSNSSLSCLMLHRESSPNIFFAAKRKFIMCVYNDRRTDAVDLSIGMPSLIFKRFEPFSFGMCSTKLTCDILLLLYN